MSLQLELELGLGSVLLLNSGSGAASRGSARGVLDSLEFSGVIPASDSHGKAEDTPAAWEEPGQRALICVLAAVKSH